MTPENHLEAIVRQVHARLAEQVTGHLTIATYGGDVVQIAQMPAMVLYLPELRRRRTEADNIPDRLTDTAGGLTEWQPSRHYDAYFRYELVADPVTMTRLVERLVLFFAADKLAVTRPARAGGTETIEYEVQEAQEPSLSAGDGGAHRMSGQIVVRNVEIRSATQAIIETASSFAAAFDRKER